MDNDPRAYIAALRSSHARLASLAEAMTDDQLTGQSYCRDWTVAQVLSHLGSGAEIALLMLEATLAGQPMDRDVMGPIWDNWNARTPQQQQADCLPADDTHIKRLEGLSDAELDGISADFFGMTLDAAGGSHRRRPGPAARRGAAAPGVRAARPRAHAVGGGQRGGRAAGPGPGGVPGTLTLDWRAAQPSARTASAAASRAQPQDSVIPAPPWP